jgi:4-alpha-glucanotransferase
MASAKQSFWQVLPLTPVGPGGSPYNAHSLFAGNTLLISPEMLVEENSLTSVPPGMRTNQFSGVDYQSSLDLKTELIQNAYKSNIQKVRKTGEFREFCSKHSSWLEDYALYKALTRAFGQPWQAWPEVLRRRETRALEEKRVSMKDVIERERFGQYLFHTQWSSLKRYSESKKIAIIGDLPFYVSSDSADTWANQDLFRLDKAGIPEFVGGVPPDYFSETGQLWGNPVYDWATMENSGYVWSMGRISRNLQLFDITRVDHFRGYVAYWEVPAGEKTAVKGKWVKTPESFLDTLKRNFPSLPFIAEDLGVITQDVKDSIDKLGIPGMKILLFAFDGSPENPYLPENHTRNFVVSTGTHDTNTVRGWFRDEATDQERHSLYNYLGRELSEENVSSEFVRLAMQSVADLCVLPLQDLLSLGSEGRMNNPSTTGNNWRWRVQRDQLTENLFKHLGDLTETYGRV